MTKKLEHNNNKKSPILIRTRKIKTSEKKKLTHTNTKMLELSNKDFKAAIITFNRQLQILLK